MREIMSYELVKNNKKDIYIPSLFKNYFFNFLSLFFFFSFSCTLAFSSNIVDVSVTITILDKQKCSNSSLFVE